MRKGFLPEVHLVFRCLKRFIMHKQKRDNPPLTVTGGRECAVLFLPQHLTVSKFHISDSA